MADEPRGCVRLEDEVEGDRYGTSDFLFCRIGSGVPLKRPDSTFDLSNPPARPLAVSEKFGLIFLAHAGGGFLVVRTTDVIRLAKDIKDVEEGNGNKKDIEKLCIQEKSILDAQIGDVHILAVCTDASILAAAIGREVLFFSVSLLINKDQEPIFTCSVGEYGHIKNFLWQKNMENSFVVLSSCGVLHHGSLESHLKDIMDGVDAVDWSVEGNFLAVARNNVLSIFSSKFKHQVDMSLSFQPWTGNTDLKVTIKVDSVKWVRSDSIVVGCVQINEDDEEVDYMVQVITAEGVGILEACSKLLVVSFNDLFHGIVDDIVPSGRGPHLFMSYLENWGLGIVANRKNTDEHVVLLAWTANDETKLPVALEFEQDKFIPRIELQENRDENLLLGIDVDRISVHEKLELKIDSEVNVLSPHCILLCLTCEGKLIMFHIVRISEPACSHEASIKPPDDVVDVRESSSVVLPLVNESTVSTTAEKDPAGKELSLGGVQSSVAKEQPSITRYRNEKTEQSSKILQLPAPSPFKQGISSVVVNSMKSGSQIYNFTFSGVGMSTSSSMGSMLSEISTSQPSNISSKSNDAGPVTAHVDSFQTASFQLQPMGKSNASYGHTVRSSLLSSNGSIPGDSQDTMGIQKHTISQSFSTTIQPTFKFSRDTDDFTLSSGSKAPFRAGYNALAPAIHSYPAPLKENSIPGKSIPSNMQDVLSSNRVIKSAGMQDSEPKLSKHFYSVNEMAKELDTLLAYIEKEGGFRDACTDAQRSFVLSLEEGLKNLSVRFRLFKTKTEEHLKQIQQLQDRRMKVSARQIYVEGLISQASNGHYWDIWNCQKLGPEFDVKQQRISKLNHSLVNELVELEQHFNALELKKYGQSDAAPRGRRGLQGSLEPSRQIYSLHSLYNTLNSQLAAAEQLSECLSKQMSVLNINFPPSKRQSITKELLESIGLEYDIDSFQSPDPKKAGYSPDSSKKSVFLLSSSRAVKEHTRRNTQRTFEPESMRRRRDSLDRSWTRFDPPKTTVKRTLQEERVKGGTEKFLSSEVASVLPFSEGFLVSQKRQEALSSSSLQSSMTKFQSQLDNFNKDDQNKLPKHLSEYQTNSLFKWKDLSQVSRDVGSRPSFTSDMQISSTHSMPVATSSSLPRNAPNRIQALGGLADKSTYEQSYVVRQPGSSMEDNSLTKARFSAQLGASVHSQTFIEASSSVFPSKITSSVKAGQSIASLNVKQGEDGPVRSSKGSMDQAVTPERSFFLLEKSHPSMLSSVSGNVSQVKTVTGRSESCGTSSSTVFSATMFPSVPGQSSTGASLSLVSLSTSPSESPAASSFKHFEGSSPITASTVGPSQTSSPSISSLVPVDAVQSFNATFQPQTSMSSTSLSLPLEDVISRSPLVTSVAPKIFWRSTASLDSEPAEAISKPQPSSVPTSEGSTGLTADKKLSLFSSAASHSLSEISFGSSSLPSTPTKGKDESLDVTITEEDEMEEESPETNTLLNLGALGGFVLGPTSASSAPKTNPFGRSLNTGTVNPTIAAFSLTTPTGELFRPASFSLPSSQSMQPSQPINPSGFSGGFTGFGQPAQIGAGQQALGSVLGAFGQSRQLGLGAQGTGFASSGGFGGGGFSGAAMSGGGGFAAAAAGGGGFSVVASGSGGFAGVAGSGFAAMASKSGGFNAAASAGGGFGASAGGFTSGGFGSFAAKHGSGGFSQFGGTKATGAGKPPAELLMQMRK